MLLARYGTIIIVIHAIVVALHGLAHQKIPVPISLAQSVFVDSVIVLAPLAPLHGYVFAAAILLWTSFCRIGGWLFFGAMTGSLLFGIYNHFIASTPDHISQIPFEGWGVLFQVTAILLLLTEGCGVALWTLNTTQQQIL